MKKLIGIALIAASATVAPAMAQRYDRGYGYEHDGRYGYEHDRGDYREQLARLGDRIERGIDRGVFDRREAWQLRSQYHHTRQIAYRYSQNGLSWRERQDLDRRIDWLRSRVRAARHDFRYDDRRDWAYR